MYNLKVLESDPSTHEASLFYAVLGTMSLYDTHCEKGLSWISYNKIAGTGQKPALGQQMSKQAFFLEEVWEDVLARQLDYLQTLRKPYPHLRRTIKELRPFVGGCTPNVFSVLHLICQSISVAHVYPNLLC